MGYVASGVGKSLFAMSAAIAIAGGGEFFGWKPDQRANGKPWKVFYVDGEMHIADLQERGETLIAACPGVDEAAANANLRLFARQDQKDGSLFPYFDGGRDAVLRGSGPTRGPDDLRQLSMLGLKTRTAAGSTR
jgi:hypothetical protein